MKHHSHGTTEYYQLVKDFKEKSNKIIFGDESLEHSAVQNLASEMEDIINYQTKNNKQVEEQESTTLVASNLDDEKPGPSSKSRPQTSLLRGKLEQPQVASKRILLIHKKQIGTTFRKNYKLSPSDFK